jgi:hypothetical protein
VLLTFWKVLKAVGIEIMVVLHVMEQIGLERRVIIEVKVEIRFVIVEEV